MIRALAINVVAAILYLSGAVWGISEGADYFLNKDLINWMFLVPFLGGIFLTLVNVIRFFPKHINKKHK